MKNKRMTKVKKAKKNAMKAKIKLCFIVGTMYVSTAILSIILFLIMDRFIGLFYQDRLAVAFGHGISLVLYIIPELLVWPIATNLFREGMKKIKEKQAKEMLGVK